MVTRQAHPMSVYVVHCVDTEGPLYESLTATFERLHEVLGVELEANSENLRKIQRGELDLGGKEEVAARMVAPALLAYNDTWDKVAVMARELMSPSFRQRHSDSEGRGWLYNWFILDHIGFDENPRHRDVGYHNIFDRYLELLSETGSAEDEVHWHFHPASTYREGHICATSFLRSPHLLETLARRVIDRAWFPSCFRAGFHTERPDSHWFLEQWIPFDFSNQAVEEDAADRAQRDISEGRFGDWRRTVRDWSPYHPSHDDYQAPGECRRVIFRCLNLGTRLRLLNQKEVDAAFARAAQGEPTVLAFVDHDFRDMRPDVRQAHYMLCQAARKYPEVRWIHSDARRGAQEVLNLDPDSRIGLEVSFERYENALRMRVESSTETFGPQPFLAVKTLDKRYLSENFDFQVPRRVWTYTFDRQSILPESIGRIGVAVNGLNGSTAVVVFDATGRLLRREQL